MRLKSFCLWLVLLLPLLLGGCAVSRSSQPAFYTLSSLADEDATYGSEVAEGGMVYGVGPVTFPDYADRPQLVTRQGANRMEIEEMHQWAGSIREDFAHVLVQNLTLLLGSDLVFAYPWKRSIPVARQVIVDVIRFDGTPGEEASLVAHWAVVNKRSDGVESMQRARYVEPVSSGGHKGVAQALSRLTARLSRDIAEALKQDAGQER